MKWVKFIILVQAILVLIFVVTFFFQRSLENVNNQEVGGSMSSGYLPSSESFDFFDISKTTVFLIVIAIFEIIVLMKAFE